MSAPIKDFQAQAELDLVVAIADGCGTNLKRMNLGQPWAGIDTVPNAIMPFPACCRGMKIAPYGKRPLVSRWYYPSSVWTDGGPIIEREKISIMPVFTHGAFFGEWRAVCMSFEGRQHSEGRGPTPLIAAMRAFVGSIPA